MEFSSDQGEWLRFFFGVIAGGLVSTAINNWLQNRRSRRDLTLKLIEQYSSLDAHRQRQMAWKLFYSCGHPQRLEEYGNAADESQASAFRYVLNFFVQAGALLDAKLIDEELFFAMSRRWMLDPYESFIGPAMRQTSEKSYVTHIAALNALERAWRRWETRSK